MPYRRISTYLIIFLSLLISLFRLSAVAQPIFRHFTKQEGIPENAVVNKIIQDRQGIMWFATTDGLFRFDSRVFTSYKYEPGNPHSMASSFVQDMLCDKQGDIWLAADGLARYNRTTDSFTTFTHDPGNKNSLSSNQIIGMMEDSRGGIWVGTSKGIDYCSVGKSKIIVNRHSLPGKHGSLLKARCMAEGTDGTLWIGTDAGLVRMKKDGSGKKVYENGHAEKLPATNLVDAIHVDKENTIWLGFRGGGLFCFDPVAEKFIKMERFKTKKEPSPHIWFITTDVHNQLWVATTSGLARFNKESQDCQWYTNEYGNPNSLTSDILYALCLDRQGGIWMGTYGAGIDYFHPGSTRFHTLKFPDDLPGGRPFDAYTIGRQKGKNLWAIEGGGGNVKFFKPPGVTLAKLPIPLDHAGAYAAFYVDDNEALWIGGISFLARFDLLKRKVDYFPLRVEDETPTLKANIITIFEDSQKRLWTGGTFGLLLFDRKHNRFQKVFTKDRESPSSTITCITEDSRQNLWAGGHDKLLVLKNGANEFEQIPIDSLSDPNKPSDIHSIREDVQGRIWFGTGFAGLQVYDPVRNRVSQYYKGQKILPNIVYEMQVDNQGNIWSSSYDGGLDKYSPEHRTIQHFDQKDGLPSDRLVSESNFQDDDGTMYFGTEKGTFYFNPKEIRVNNNEQPILFSSLKLFNKPVRVADETGILSQSLHTAKEIVFRHDQNVFTLDFALLNYIRSDKNQYAYMLEGFEKQWNYVSTPSATYTNLSPGSYTFLVKAANNDGYWNKHPARLKITILPPWWKTWYAYLAYLVIFIAAIYAITRFFWARNLFRKESELYQAKLDFFTNVSHEIRTHLTLIDGPLQKVYQSRSIEPDNRNLLSYAKKNSDRLMSLVGELLEFRKMESGDVTLQVSEQNLVDNLKLTHSAFEHLFKEKKITTSLAFPTREIQVWYDASQMQKVFYNLLSNACKFTPEGGTVRVTVEEDDKYAWVNVIDNGRGIDQRHLEKVFESFFQEYNQETPNRGYGIGLALSRKIVERHQGLLTARSESPADDQRETCFSIQILKGNAHFNTKELLKSPEIVRVTDISGLTKELSPTRQVPSQRKYTVLLIEDNEELRAFTREVLENSYKILEAPDGRAGITLAKEHVPDLIVSDIMMPEMNGLDLCTQLKSDIRTSHIPVVLLTARGATHHMVQGLKAGADAYVVKPFDIRVLELKIQNLIRTRQVLQHRGNPFVSVQSDGLVMTELDRQFLAKLTALAEQNISDVDFGVSQMAAEVGISVSVLYRKVRALTDMTVNDFVKSIRMQKAEQLLLTKAYNVNEVALMVGFENRKYFSREFQKVYGKLPSKYEVQPAEKVGDYM